MIHTIEYICRTDGSRKTSSNVSSDIKFGYNIYESRNSIGGSITASTYIDIKCDCGITHSFLFGEKTENIK